MVYRILEYRESIVVDLFLEYLGLVLPAIDCY